MPSTVMVAPVGAVTDTGTEKAKFVSEIVSLPVNVSVQPPPVRLKAKLPEVELARKIPYVESKNCVCVSEPFECTFPECHQPKWSPVYVAFHAPICFPLTFTESLATVQGTSVNVDDVASLFGIYHHPWIVPPGVGVVGFIRNQAGCPTSSL